MSDAAFGGVVLLDNSAWARMLIGRVPAGVQRRWEAAVGRNEIAACDPFRLEALYSARDAVEYNGLAQELDALLAAPCDRETWILARRAQAALAAAPGISHRVRGVDLLIAAAAHQHRMGVLHYDHDFDVISQHTPLEFASVWLAPRGTLG